MQAYYKGEPIFGPAGKDATVNGVNALKLVPGDDIRLEQEGDTLTISAEGGGESAGSGWEVYSTEERRIGTWIDGKPLYQRVVHWEGTFDTDSTRKALPITAITTESLVSCYGSIRAKDWPISVPFADTSSSNFAYTEIWNSFLYLSTRLGPSNTITEVNVMLTYTKTTD